MFINSVLYPLYWAYTIAYYSAVFGYTIPITIIFYYHCVIHLYYYCHYYISYTTARITWRVRSLAAMCQAPSIIVTEYSEWSSLQMPSGGRLDGRLHSHTVSYNQYYVIQVYDLMNLQYVVQL